MSLIKCGNCGKEISDSASSCVHCGNVKTNGSATTSSKNRLGVFASIGAIFFLVTFLLLTILVWLGLSSSGIGMIAFIHALAPILANIFLAVSILSICLKKE